MIGVGDLVVCIKPFTKALWRRTQPPTWVVVGVSYLVVDVRLHRYKPGMVAIKVASIPWWWWSADHFRKVEDTKFEEPRIVSRELEDA